VSVRTLLVAVLLLSLASPSWADTFSVPANRPTPSTLTGPATAHIAFNVPPGTWSCSPVCAYVGGPVSYTWAGQTTPQAAGSLSGGVVHFSGGLLSLDLVLNSADTITLGVPSLSVIGTPASPPPPATDPCSVNYPASVASYLAGAPTPCMYHDASKGFNQSSAPLIMATLAALVVILAIWLGHESVISLFKRLLTGSTG